MESRGLQPVIGLIRLVIVHLGCCGLLCFTKRSELSCILNIFALVAIGLFNVDGTLWLCELNVRSAI